jgi:hypothetical protein
MIQYTIISIGFLILEVIILKIVNPKGIKKMIGKYPIILFICLLAMAILWPITLLGVVFSGMIIKGKSDEVKTRI